MPTILFPSLRSYAVSEDSHACFLYNSFITNDGSLSLWLAIYYHMYMKYIKVQKQLSMKIAKSFGLQSCG